MQVAEVFDRASGKLPMIPKVVQVLVNSFNRADVINSQEIGETVGHDQVLTARVLRLANSARFGGSRRVGSLDEALIILGFDNLRILVIASGVTGATANIPNFDLKLFWQRCFQIANTCKVVAHLAGQNPQLAFTCGLLARIGELVLHVAVPDKTPEIDRLVAQGRERMEVETELLGVDSAHVGSELAWRWSLPDNIVSAIGKQHPQAHPADTPALATVIRLSRQIVHQFNQGQPQSAVQASLPADTLALLGIGAEQISEAMPELQNTSTLIDELL
jgi:HD-like signal output (HDOD) protein